MCIYIYIYIHTYIYIYIYIYIHIIHQTAHVHTYIINRMYKTWENVIKQIDGQNNMCIESKTLWGWGWPSRRAFDGLRQVLPCNTKKSMAHQAHGIKVNSKHQSQLQPPKSNPSIKVNCRNQSQAPKSTHIRKSIPGTNLKAWKSYASHAPSKVDVFAAKITGKGISTEGGPVPSPSINAPSNVTYFQVEGLPRWRVGRGRSI